MFEPRALLKQMPADALHGIQGVAGFSATTAGDAAAEAEAEADATVAVSSASAIQQRAAGLRTIIWILSGEERWGAWGQVGGGSWSLSDAVASPRSLLVRTAGERLTRFTTDLRLLLVTVVLELTRNSENRFD